MDIIEKITALIKKAESAQEIGSLNEANIFMAKAQELIAKYNVDKSKLGAKNESLYAFSEEVKATPGEPQWERQLAAVIGHYSFCNVLRNREWKKKRYVTQTIQFVGDGQNVQCCVFLFNFVRTQILSLSRKHWHSVSGDYPQKSRQKIIRYFLIGAVAGLQEKLSDKATDQSNAIVKSESKNISKWILAHNPQMSTGRKFSMKADSTHYSAGQDAAGAISLNSPIAAKAPERKLIS